MKLSDEMASKADEARARFKSGEGEYWDGRADAMNEFLVRVSELERENEQLLEGLKQLRVRDLLQSSQQPANQGGSSPDTSEDPGQDGE